jgi:hypothetical protein
MDIECIITFITAIHRAERDSGQFSMSTQISCVKICEKDRNFVIAFFVGQMTRSNDGSNKKNQPF